MQHSMDQGKLAHKCTTLLPTRDVCHQSLSQISVAIGSKLHVTGDLAKDMLMHHVGRHMHLSFWNKQTVLPDFVYHCCLAQAAAVAGQLSGSCAALDFCCQ